MNTFGFTLISLLCAALVQSAHNQQHVLTPDPVQLEMDSGTKYPPRGMTLLDSGTNHSTAESQCAALGNSTSPVILCTIEDVLSSWIVDGERHGFKLFNERSEVEWAWTGSTDDAGKPYMVDNGIFARNSIAPMFKTVSTGLVYPLCCGEYTRSTVFSSSTGGAASSTGTNEPTTRPGLIIHDHPGTGFPPYKDHCVIEPVGWKALFNSFLFDPRHSSIAATGLVFGNNTLSRTAQETDWLLRWFNPNPVQPSNGVVSVGVGGSSAHTEAGGEQTASVQPRGTTVQNPDDGGTVDQNPQVVGSLFRWRQQRELERARQVQRRAEAVKQASVHYTRQLLAVGADSQLPEDHVHDNFEYHGDLQNTYALGEDSNIYVPYPSMYRMCARFGPGESIRSASAAFRLLFAGPTQTEVIFYPRSTSSMGFYLTFTSQLSNTWFIAGCDGSTEGQCKLTASSQSQPQPITLDIESQYVLRAKLQLGPTASLSVELLALPSLTEYTPGSELQSLGSVGYTLTSDERDSLVLADGTFVDYQIGFRFDQVGSSATGSSASDMTCIDDLDVTCASADSCTRHCIPGSQYNPSLSGPHLCTLCDAGKFSSTGGESSCQPCDAGQVSLVTGSTQCLPCPSSQQPGGSFCAEIAIAENFNTFPWPAYASAVSETFITGDAGFMFTVQNTLCNSTNGDCEADLQSSSTHVRPPPSLALPVFRQHQRRKAHGRSHVHTRFSDNQHGVVIGLTSQDTSGVTADHAIDMNLFEYAFLLREGFVTIVEGGAIVQPAVVEQVDGVRQFVIKRSSTVISYFVSEANMTPLQLRLIYTSRRPARACRYWSAVSFEAIGDEGGASVVYHQEDVIPAPYDYETSTWSDLRDLTDLPDTRTLASVQEQHHDKVQSPQFVGFPVMHTAILGAHFFVDECPADAAMPLTCADTYMSNDVLYWTTNFCSATLVACPRDCNATITGTLRYTGDSHICTAARHALGQDGGLLIFNPMSGSERFEGTFSHGILSESWPSKFPVTFRLDTSMSTWQAAGYCGEVEPPLHAGMETNKNCSWMTNYHVCELSCRSGYYNPDANTNSVGMMCKDGVWLPPYPSCTTEDATGRVGCFSNVTLQRDTYHDNNFTFIESGHSIESCSLLARQQGATHFGIGGAHDCFVGTEYEQFGEGSCDQLCRAFPNEQCGGSSSWMVYDLTLYTPPRRPLARQPTGCYNAPVTGNNYQGPGHTVWSCGQLALNAYESTPFFGLSRGTHCYLGTGQTMADLGPALSDDQCSLPCRAYPFDPFRCGGPNTITTFNTVNFVRILDIGANGGLRYDAYVNSSDGTTTEVWTNELKSFEFGDGNIKHHAFNSVPFSVIRLCIVDTQKCILYQHQQVFESAVDLFTSGYIAMDVDATNNFASIWPEEYYNTNTNTNNQCTAVMPGFNVLCPGPYNTRWGFCGVANGGQCGGEGVVNNQFLETSTQDATRATLQHTAPKRTSSWLRDMPPSDTLTSLSSVVYPSPAIVSAIRPRSPSRAALPSPSSRHLLSAAHNNQQKAESMKLKRIHQQERAQEEETAAAKTGVSLLDKKEVAQHTHTQSAPHFIVSSQVDVVESVIGIGLDTPSEESPYGAGASKQFFNANSQSLSKPLLAYIDIIQQDDWTLIMAIGEDDVLAYDSPLWHNTDVYPDNQDGTQTDAHGNAKYLAYSQLRFSQIRVCVGAPLTNCITATLKQVYANAAQLFSGEYTELLGVDHDVFYDVFDPWSRPPCKPQKLGFNVVCENKNGEPVEDDESPYAVRWGFCGGSTEGGSGTPCGTANTEGVIGVGLRSRLDCCSAGAGYNNMFVYNRPVRPLDNGTFPDGQGHSSQQRAWIYIRPLPEFPF